MTCAEASSGTRQMKTLESQRTGRFFKKHDDFKSTAW